LASERGGDGEKERECDKFMERERDWDSEKLEASGSALGSSSEKIELKVRIKCSQKRNGMKSCAFKPLNRK
jgi:hypothetical protein